MVTGLQEIDKLKTHMGDIQVPLEVFEWVQWWVIRDSSDSNARFYDLTLAGERSLGLNDEQIHVHVVLYV